MRQLGIARTPPEALAIHGGVAFSACRRVEPGGLINTTWLVGDGPVFILQQVNAIFPPATHQRIHAVTEHIAARGLATPLIIPAADGRLVLPGPDGTCWRLMSFIPGTSPHRVTDGAMALQAGALVGRFHSALLDYPGDLTPLRPDPHDTLRHMRTLRQALQDCGGHRLRSGIEQVGQAVLAGWQRWQGAVGLSDLPLRPAHGDLKISNLRFGEDGRAICLIDLDTLGSMPLALELGDAFRSWCNRGGEDQAQVSLDLQIFAAGLQGYRSTAHFASREELAAVPPGCWRICLELAARFCADACYEKYFGWDPAEAPGRGEHNLLRARGQLALAAAVEERLPELLMVVAHQD